MGKTIRFKLTPSRMSKLGNRRRISLNMSVVAVDTEGDLLLVGLVAVWFLQGVFTESTSIKFKLDQVLQATSARICLALLFSGRK